MSYQHHTFLGLTLVDLLIAILLPLVGFLLGWFIEKRIMTALRTIASKTETVWDDILVFSLKRIPPILFLLAGLYSTLHWLPITGKALIVGEKSMLAGFLIVLTVFFSRIAKSLLAQSIAPLGKNIPSVSIFSHLVSILVYSVGLLMILQSLGISVTPIITALGIGGLAVALALQDTLANFFAGMNILLSKQIRPGDFIRIDTTTEGIVADINWRSTTIKTLQNNLVIIPNSKLGAALFTNFNMPEPEMTVPVEINVAYNSDLEKVERVTVDTAKTILKECVVGQEEFEPFVRFHTFGSYTIHLTAFLRVKQVVDQGLLKHHFLKALLVRYQKEGIEIPFPIQTVNITSQKQS